LVRALPRGFERSISEFPKRLEELEVDAARGSAELLYLSIFSFDYASALPWRLCVILFN
jgi:hypothetical protein